MRQIKPPYPNAIVLAVSTIVKPVQFHVSVKSIIQNGLGELS
jgi:hypothetical protein